MEIDTNDLYLSLGSNLGDRINYLRQAIDRINDLLGKVTLVSAVYETPPWGFESTSPFLNLCLHLTTAHSPESVLVELKSIEKALGREKKQESGYSSREIDIDIILFGMRTMEQGNLCIPHPRYTNRRFVLQPLNDIASYCIDPTTHLTIGQLLANCTDNSEITCYVKEL